MEYIKTNVPGFVIDPRTKAVLQLNNTGLELYRIKKDESFKISHLQREIDDLKKMVLSLISEKQNDK